MVRNQGCDDLVRIQLADPKPNCGFSELCGVTVSPILFSDKVTDRKCMGLVIFPSEIAEPDFFVIFFQDQGPRNPPTRLIALDVFVEVLLNIFRHRCKMSFTSNITIKIFGHPKRPFRPISLFAFFAVKDFHD